MVTNLETAECIYRKKVFVARRVFKSSSFGFRISKSIYQAMYCVKTT